MSGGLGGADGSGPLAASATLRLRFPDARAAKDALAALQPDDPACVQLQVDGAELVVAARASSALGLLRTLDDVLGCLRATGMP